MRKQLMRAHSERSEELLMEVLRLLQTLAEGWIGAIDRQNVTPEQPANADLEKPAREVNVENPYSEQPKREDSKMRSWQL
jgi:hypothetical protein